MHVGREGFMSQTKLYAHEMEGPKRTSAYLIFDTYRGKHVEGDLEPCGKIIAAYPKDGAGKVVATVWDWTSTQPKTHKLAVSGYGFNKLAAIMGEVETFGRCQKINEGSWEHSLREAGYTLFSVI
jgi:hypothetical protein